MLQPKTRHKQFKPKLFHASEIKHAIKRK